MEKFEKIEDLRKFLAYAKVKNPSDWNVAEAILRLMDHISFLERRLSSLEGSLDHLGDIVYGVDD